MKVTLGYGNGQQEVSIPNRNLQAVLLPQETAKQEDEETLLRKALLHPVGTSKLRAIIRPGEKIAVVASDMTRPLPTGRIMPVLLEEMIAGGARPEDITLIFGLGIHRHHTEAEKRKLAGEAVYERIRCVDSEPEDCILLGYTSRGTPVEITREVASADRIVCLGNIEYHYFAGFSGGAKAILPGAASRAAIQKNHSHMMEPGAESGCLEGNPVREDIEEAGALCNIDFILNVVLDAEKRILWAAAGDPVQVHRAGCGYVDSCCRRKLQKAADIVIVSQGGAPKDLNLYQMQKALNHAAYAVRDGGIIIMAGYLGEGMGEPVFEQWMREAENPEELVRKIGREFCLGGHKAAAIGAVLRKADIFLVSSLPDSQVKEIFMHPFGSVQEALQTAFQKIGEEASVVVMPVGGSILPDLK
ncbi:DUF2088 domain-containing protein [Lactonifactor longoviformis]|uniref:Nickel-dependent lactate racemase n=1 Tax=Lactonifactor longoviformis DSM 17459 TaxID=1122155 RepID=A0A1M4TYG2_9CLOT|nr:nickel-dependent lactate racemase [Lactonifactor longoviformis]POP32768.1 DUF2088 domain-containing protein [Lactonifactor longoviformis]SHE49403.1 Nickel-dependent lactate racemase [Lactonifactor longoviformis DSM 17459]